MARLLKDWLDGYLKYTENSEPPQSYHRWIGIGVIASALQRRVYLRWGRDEIYPNLYIILVGPSGRAKKGTALKYAGPILRAVSEIEVGQGAVTREKLIRRMASAVRNFSDGTTGAIKFQCALTWISDELSVFLGQQNVKFLADLCDWYDSPPDWKYDTKNMGTDKLDGVCFNLIGATAPDWMHSILPREAVGGGFTSRVVWIVEEDKGKTVVFPTYDIEVEQALKRDLESMMPISGEFTMTKEADDWYEEWYTEEDKRIKSGRMPVPDPKMAGYCERRATLIKKLAIIMSMSEASTLKLEKRHFERSLKFMLSAEEKMATHRLFGELGSARYAIATEKVLGFIYKHQAVTKSQIMNFFYRDIDLFTYKVVMETLEARGVIKREIKPGEEVVTLVKGKLAW